MDDFDVDLLESKKDTDFKGYMVTFCQTTSMKGMARITRSERLSMRILWLIAVVLFLGMAAFFVYNLVNEYLNRATVTNINEGVVSAVDPILPPQVTVCNLNPFSGTAQEDAIRHGIPIIEDFRLALNDFTSCPSCSTSEQAKRDSASEDLQYVGGYYQYIGRNASIKLSHTQDMLIVECQTLALLGFRLLEEPCADVVKITRISTSDDFNCFQFYINTTANTERFFLGLSLTLYLDNFRSMVYPARFTIDESLGVKVSVDAPGTVPFNAIETIHIPPGKWSHVQVAQETRQRMEKPYGDCHKGTDFGFFHSTKEEKIYTLRACTSLCVEKLVLEECDCMDANMMNLLPEMEPQLTWGVKFCEDLKVSANMFLKNKNCARYYRQQGFELCESNCSFPCSETIYKTSMSQSLWPKEYDMAGFRSAYIAGKPFEDRFVSEEQWQTLPQTELVQDNFLRLSVYHGDYRFNVFNESAAISQSAFLSQLGGSLNLWSGITIIVLMEILDLCYQIIKDKMFPPPRMPSHGITVS